MEQFVVVAERSGGNETVGDAWLETKIFFADTTLKEAYEWAQKKRVSGKTIITKPDEEDTYHVDKPDF